MKRSPLRRSIALRRVTRIRRVARKPKRRAREEQEPAAVAYKAWIRRLPCAGCGRMGVDPHHAGHEHGMGEKASWRTLIPLDRRCHDMLHGAKGVFADQPRRREWEDRIVAACWVLYGHNHEDYPVTRTEVELAFSVELAWLKGATR